MAQRKPYNPNTAYGRRKLKEQAQRHYNELPSDQKQDWNNTGCLIMIIIIIIVLFIGAMTGNQHGAVKWLNH